ncbi:unnamed protein product [Boreogadus saida]
MGKLSLQQVTRQTELMSRVHPCRDRDLNRRSGGVVRSASLLMPGSRRSRRLLLLSRQSDTMVFEDHLPLADFCWIHTGRIVLIGFH